MMFTNYYCSILLQQDALEKKIPISMEMPINNLDRTTGTILSYEISTRYGEAGLPDDTIHVKFTGHAGQSLGFCLAKGVHLEVCPSTGITTTSVSTDMLMRCYCY
jgi:glutamate synthase domain-containing protein 3